MAKLDWDHARKRDLARKGDAEPGDAPRLKPGRDPVPMSPRQRKYLKSLCLRHGRSFDPTMSRREASALIRDLAARRPQSRGSQ